MITLDWLEGRWHLSRRIEDAMLSRVGRMQGVSVWQADAEGLVQDESGDLYYGTEPVMKATRRYLWRAGAGALRVLFEDGRAFYTLPAPGQVALHDCPPDTYRVTYALDGPDRFQTRWHVTGPRKDAVITSEFNRAHRTH